jgi:phosphoenolpyruvate-protein phosphotransferase (PTS system enzyme I)
MSLLLTGIGVSRGIAIGKVHLLQRGKPDVIEYSIPSHLIEREVLRFRAALSIACEQLRSIRNAIPSDARQEVTDFIDTHLLMLDDTLLSRVPETLIREHQLNAEWALQLQRDELVAVFDQMQDPYLRTRRDDIDHVIHLVQRILLNQQAKVSKQVNLRNHIIVADDLSPADTVVLQHQQITGFLTETGGPLSHTAILARSLSIPAVVGIHEAVKLLRNEEKIVLDGDEGMVMAEVDDKVIRYFRQRQHDERYRRKQLPLLRTLPTVTRDGHVIKLQANIEFSKDIRALRHIGADGVGLYRTEFLFLERDQPADEDEQLQNYLEVVNALKGKPLTIRTVDLGAEKECNTAYQRSQIQNPALGLRAIRRSLKNINMFRVQLRAILRASARGPVRIMFPMLTSSSELRQVLRLLDTTKSELELQQFEFDAHIPVGAMIEVPAAALSANIFARHVDFLSIGTNDLIQYTLAIDRIDNEVNYLYDPLHPAVLKLIHWTLMAGRRANIPIAMCGEMAGDTRYTRLLLGMGLREFSTPPATLLEVKQIITRCHIGELEKRCSRILNSRDPERLASLVDALNQ